MMPKIVLTRLRCRCRCSSQHQAGVLLHWNERALQGEYRAAAGSDGRTEVLMLDFSQHSKDEFVHVDVGYPERFAKTCKDAGVSHFSLISSVNASSSSLSRFGRTKFKAEVAVKDVGFAKTSIFRPSVLKTPGARYGLKGMRCDAMRCKCDLTQEWLQIKCSRARRPK